MKNKNEENEPQNSIKQLIYWIYGVHLRYCQPFGFAYIDYLTVKYKGNRRRIYVNFNCCACI